MEGKEKINILSKFLARARKSFLLHTVISPTNTHIKVCRVLSAAIAQTHCVYIWLRTDSKRMHINTQFYKVQD